MDSPTSILKGAAVAEPSSRFNDLVGEYKIETEMGCHVDEAVVLSSSYGRKKGSSPDTR